MHEQLKEILRSKRPLWQKQEEIIDIIEDEKKKVFIKTKDAFTDR